MEADWWEMDAMKRQFIRDETAQTYRGFSTVLPEAARYTMRAEDLASATAVAMGRPKLGEPLRIAAFWMNLDLFNATLIHGLKLEDLLAFEGNGDKAHLDAEMDAELKRHVTRAVRNLRLLGIPDTSSITLGVLHHHERLDGSGYPQGLKEEEISLEGRILGAVSYFIAHGENKKVLEDMKKDPRFDPDVVEALEEAEMSLLHKPPGIAL